MTMMNLIANAKTERIMKKTLFYVGAALAIAFSLTGCQKEIQNPEENSVVKKGGSFEIIAKPVETKTVNDGMNTKWEADDAINVFHAIANSTTYTSDGEFDITNPESNSFNGEVAEPLEEGKTYDWYMVYPYNSHLVSVANTGDNPARYYIGKRSDEAQEQDGNDSKAHLAGSNYPLFGVQKGVAYNVKPSLSVNHIASYIEVKVTNSNDDPLTVESVSFTAPDGEKIVGQYNIDFSQEPMTFTMYKTYASETANLTVLNGASIAKGETASFFLGIKPFIAASDKVLKVSVNGYEKEIKLTKQTTFTAGKIKKINFNYDFDASSIAKATFVFNTAAGLNDLGITAPSTSQETVLDGNTYTSNGISLSFATNGASTDVRVWNSNGSYDLRTYLKNKLTFTAPNGYNITSIVLTGSSVNNFTSNPAGYSSGTWSGDAVSVTLTASASGKINTINVVCEKAQVVPTIVSNEVSDLAAPGAEYTETVNLINYDSAPSLSATVDGTVVTAASVSDVTTTSATVTYTVSNNISGAARTGSIILTDAANNVTGEITIGQKADVFTVSNTNIELAAAAGATKTLTLTSNYAWTIDDALIDGFTVNPMSGEGSSSGITLTVTSTDANASASVVELGAFAVQRTVDGKESATITVSQKSAKLATPVISITPDGANKKFEASWSAISNAKRYVYYVLDEDANIVVDETTVTSLSVVVEGLDTGVEYTIYVKAQGDSPYIDSEEGYASVTLSAGVVVQTLSITMNEYVEANSITVSAGSDIGDICTSLALNDVVTMSTTGNPNCGTFWGTSTIDWRLYQNANGNVTISVPTGYTLVSVKFTYSSSNSGVLKDSNLGNVNSGTTKTVSGTSITYTVGNTSNKTNGQVRITAVEVKYKQS